MGAKGSFRGIWFAGISELRTLTPTAAALNLRAMAKFPHVEVMAPHASQNIPQLIAACYHAASTAGVTKEMLQEFLKEFGSEDAYLDALEVCRRWFRISEIRKT